MREKKAPRQPLGINTIPTTCQDQEKKRTITRPTDTGRNVNGPSRGTGHPAELSEIPPPDSVTVVGPPPRRLGEIAPLRTGVAGIGGKDSRASVSCSGCPTAGWWGRLVSGVPPAV